MKEKECERSQKTASFMYNFDEVMQNVIILHNGKSKSNNFITNYYKLLQTTNSELITISLRIPENVWVAFKTYVFEKYGRFHGILGAEVSHALVEYLTARTHNDSQSKNNQGNESLQGTKTIITVRRILNLILRETQNDVPQSLLERIMFNIGLGDDRTHKKYIKILIGLGVLTPDRFEAKRRDRFIYKINLEKARQLMEA